MQSETAIIVDDGVTGIGAALEAKRTTMSECSASISVIFPLPSSPQFAPTIAFTMMQDSFYSVWETSVSVVHRRTT